MTKQAAPRTPNTFENLLFGTTINRVPSLIPGVAMAAVGLGTSVAQLKGLGFKPFVVGIAAAVAVGAVSIGLVFLFAPLISV